MITLAVGKKEPAIMVVNLWEYLRVSSVSHCDDLFRYSCCD